MVEKIGEISIILPLGHFCQLSNLFKVNNLKKFSLPFDWIRCSIKCVSHMLNDDFKIFMDKKYYIDNTIKNKNLQLHKCSHAFYENNFKCTRVWNHHNMFDEKDYHYYKRCIDRFKNCLNSEKPKLFCRLNINMIDELDEIYLLDSSISRLCKKQNYYLLIIHVFTGRDNKSHKIIRINDKIFIINMFLKSNSNGMEFLNNDDNKYLMETIKQYFKFLI